MEKEGFSRIRLQRENELLIMENSDALYADRPEHSGAVVCALNKHIWRNLIHNRKAFGPFFWDRFHPGGDVPGRFFTESKPGRNHVGCRSGESAFHDGTGDWVL